jgi:hypothetical protein
MRYPGAIDEITGREQFWSLRQKIEGALPISL